MVFRLFSARIAISPLPGIISPIAGDYTGGIWLLKGQCLLFLGETPTLDIDLPFLCAVLLLSKIPSEDSQVPYSPSQCFAQHASDEGTLHRE